MKPSGLTAAEAERLGVPEITSEEIKAFLRTAARKEAGRRCVKPHRPKDSPCSCGWVTWKDRPAAGRDPTASIFRKLWPDPGKPHIPYVRLNGVPEAVRTELVIGLLMTGYLED